MKAKIIITFAVLFVCVALSAIGQTTQYVTLTSCLNCSVITNNLPVQPNQIVSVVGYDRSLTPGIQGNLTNGNLISFRPISGATTGGSYIPQTVTGLTNIFLSTSGGWATFQITTPATTTVISNYIPADAIVIPASATGNVQIILESSPDLVNWTAANPGTYGASAGTNRFFRVRALAIP